MLQFYPTCVYYLSSWSWVLSAPIFAGEDGEWSHCRKEVEADCDYRIHLSSGSVD